MSDQAPQISLISQTSISNIRNKKTLTKSLSVQCDQDEYRKITDGNSVSNFLHLHFILYQQVYPQIPKRSVNFAYQYDRKQQL